MSEPELLSVPRPYIEVHKDFVARVRSSSPCGISIASRELPPLHSILDGTKQAQSVMEKFRVEEVERNLDSLGKALELDVASKGTAHTKTALTVSLMEKIADSDIVNRLDNWALVNKMDAGQVLTALEIISAREELQTYDGMKKDNPNDETELTRLSTKIYDDRINVYKREIVSLDDLNVWPVEFRRIIQENLKLDGYFPTSEGRNAFRREVVRLGQAFGPDNIFIQNFENGSREDELGLRVNLPNTNSFHLGYDSVPVSLMFTGGDGQVFSFQADKADRELVFQTQGETLATIEEIGENGYLWVTGDNTSHVRRCNGGLKVVSTGQNNHSPQVYIEEFTVPQGVDSREAVRAPGNMDAIVIIDRMGDGVREALMRGEKTGQENLFYEPPPEAKIEKLKILGENNFPLLTEDLLSVDLPDGKKAFKTFSVLNSKTGKKDNYAIVRLTPIKDVNNIKASNGALSDRSAYAVFILDNNTTAPDYKPYFLMAFRDPRVDPGVAQWNNDKLQNKMDEEIKTRLGKRMDLPFKINLPK